MKISFLPLLAFVLATANAQADPADTPTDGQGVDPGNRATDTPDGAVPNPRYGGPTKEPNQTN